MSDRKSSSSEESSEEDEEEEVRPSDSEILAMAKEHGWEALEKASKLQRDNYEIVRAAAMSDSSRYIIDFFSPFFFSE